MLKKARFSQVANLLVEARISEQCPVDPKDWRAEEKPLPSIRGERESACVRWKVSLHPFRPSWQSFSANRLSNKDNKGYVISCWICIYFYSFKMFQTISWHISSIVPVIYSTSQFSLCQEAVGPLKLECYRKCATWVTRSHRFSSGKLRSAGPGGRPFHNFHMWHCGKKHVVNRWRWGYLASDKPHANRTISYTLLFGMEPFKKFCPCGMMRFQFYHDSIMSFSLILVVDRFGISGQMSESMNRPRKEAACGMSPVLRIILWLEQKTAHIMRTTYHTSCSFFIGPTHSSDDMNLSENSKMCD